MPDWTVQNVYKKYNSLTWQLFLKLSKKVVETASFLWYHYGVRVGEMILISVKKNSRHRRLDSIMGRDPSNVSRKEENQVIREHFQVESSKLAQNIKNLRLAHEETQDDLAIAINVTKSTISNLKIKSFKKVTVENNLIK